MLKSMPCRESGGLGALPGSGWPKYNDVCHYNSFDTLDAISATKEGINADDQTREV